MLTTVVLFGWDGRPACTCVTPSETLMVCIGMVRGERHALWWNFMSASLNIAILSCHYMDSSFLVSPRRLLHSQMLVQHPFKRRMSVQEAA